MFFTLCTVYDTSSSKVFWEVFTGSIYPFEIIYLISEAQWGGLDKEVYIEPQQPHLAKGEKLAAHETQAFDCWDSRKHTTKQERFGGKRTRSHTHTQTHVHADHALRDARHTDTTVPLWH